jgi:hypothetical protein
MEALKFLAAQDARMRRKEFSVADFIAAFPWEAAGVFAPRMNLNVRIDDDEGEVYDPHVDDDSAQLVVSLAMPVSDRCRQSVLAATYELLLLRDRPTRSTVEARLGDHGEASSSSSGEAEETVDDHASDARVDRHTAATRAAEVALKYAALNDLTAAAPGNNDACIDPVCGLSPWDKEDIQLVKATADAVERALPFIASPLGVLPRIKYTLQCSAAARLSAEGGRRALLEAVLGGLEAVRWRLVRAALEGAEVLDETLRDFLSSLARRITRRRLPEVQASDSLADTPPSDASASESALRCINLPLGDAPPKSSLLAAGDSDAAVRLPAVGKRALEAARAFEGVVATGGSVLQVAERTWGGSDGAVAGAASVPRWYAVALAWEAAVLEAEFIAAGR